MRISDWSSDVCSSDLGSLGGYRLRNYDICQSCTRDHYSPRTHFHRPCIVRTDKAFLSWMAWPNHKLHCLACCNHCGHDSDYRSRSSCNGSIKSEEHTSELQSLMRSSYAVFCLKKKK